MNHLTKLIIASFFTKNTYCIKSLAINTSQKPKFHQLTHKIAFLESTKPQKGGFKNGDKGIPFQEYIRQSINKFPYCKLPRYNQRFSQQKQLTGLQYDKLVAFNSLFVVNEANKQKQLREMAEILLKENYEKLTGRLSKLSGAEVFSLYYTPKLLQFVRDINENEVDEQKVTYYYQVLTNIIPSQQFKPFVQKIKEQKIFQMNPHIISLHIKLLVRNGLPYIHALDKLYQNCLLLVAQTTQSKKQPYMGEKILQAAKSLLSIQGYEDILSENIKSVCMKIIIQNVTNMEPFDHIMVIKHIYMSSSQDCITYIDKVTDQIMTLHKLTRSDELHVPLMLKVIKYRSKLHLDNKMFLDIINSYPDKFNTVFRQKNINKEVFLSLTTKQATTQLNPEIRTQFGSFIKKVFEEYEKKQEIDQEELVRNLKLILKYGNEIKKEQLSQVMELMVDNLYQRIKHAASPELKYYIFLVAYTFNFENLLVRTTIVHQTVETYHSKCLHEPNTQNITRSINIEYQLMRKASQPQLRKNIWAYNYSQVDLHPAVYSYLFFLFRKDRTPGINKQKIQTINQLKKNIYKNLSQGSYSMKIIYTLIDVLDELKYNDKYMYVDIERGIGKNLDKFLTMIEAKKGVELPLPKDIAFLKNKLAKNNLCSTKFSEFLDQSEKNYHMIHEYAKQYLQKSRNWQKMKDNTKRNKQNAEKGQKNIENK